MAKTIIGVDPGITRLGWAVILADGGRCKYISSGVIPSSTKDEMPRRLASIANRFEQILSIHTPDMMAMEDSFVGKNAQSAIKLGYIRGTLMYISAKHKMDFCGYKPNVVKKALTGSGHADKSQMLQMISLLFPDAKDIKVADQADAIAVAYTCSCFNKI